MDLPQSIQSQVFSEILDEDVQKGISMYMQSDM